MMLKMMKRKRSMRKKIGKKIRKKLPTFRVTWDEHLRQLRPGEFKKRYRMPEEKFNYLLELLADVDPYFKEVSAQTKKKCQNMFGGVGPVDVRHKLAAAIRWFAGGSYLDIKLVHGMQVPTMYTCAWHAVDAINKSPQLQLIFPWDDDAKLEEIELGFAGLCEGKVRGCVFALDGFCIRIIAPSGIPNPQDYWNRKGFYAFVVQAGVDSTGKFTTSSIKAVGSTHDSLAFRMSKFHEYLEAGKLSRDPDFFAGLCAGLRSLFGMGDDAYGNRIYCCTP